MWNGSSVIRYSNTCGLPGVLVELLQMGFEKPCEGNRCIVEARISLPAQAKELSPDYCFGEALVLCGQPLIPGWGKELAPGLRTACMQAMADTFAEAFEGIEKDVMLALEPLAVAFYERREKLKVKGWKP